jgi:hypothetical protein
MWTSVSPLTKAAAGHASIQSKYAQTTEPKPFKMKKFDNVPAKLSIGK